MTNGLGKWMPSTVTLRSGPLVTCRHHARRDVSGDNNHERAVVTYASTRGRGSSKRGRNYPVTLPSTSSIALAMRSPVSLAVAFTCLDAGLVARPLRQPVRGIISPHCLERGAPGQCEGIETCAEQLCAHIAASTPHHTPSTIPLVLVLNLSSDNARPNNRHAGGLGCGRGTDVGQAIAEAVAREPSCVWSIPTFWEHIH